MPPTPRTPAWPGFPRDPGIDDYVPLDHLERCAAHLAAVGQLGDIPIPLTRCGEPSLTPLERQLLLLRRGNPRVVIGPQHRAAE